MSIKADKLWYSEAYFITKAREARKKKIALLGAQTIQKMHLSV